ncbi:MAG: hypothetical protein AAGA96_09775 [Verrucomicrobiota bacterium]
MSRSDNSSSPGESMTPAEKLAAVQRVKALLESDGLSVPKACIRVGITRSSYYRWEKAVDVAALMPKKPTGRPPKFDLNEEETVALRSWRQKKESIDVAVEQFVHDEACRPETAAALIEIMETAAARRRKPSWPMSLRRAAELTDEEAADFRGPRALQAFEPVGYRLMEYVGEDGTRHEIGPNDVRESDDMSVNQKFRFTDPETGNELLGRQVLFTNDLFSQKFLGAAAIGRPRDAYRVEDIADHMLAVCEAWGLPKIWRLERGSWESHFIRGIPLDDKAATSRGLGGERFEGKRWGGLNELFHVDHTWKSRGKGSVEVSFNLLQRLLAHESEDIGRRRGEFERAARHDRRAKAGNDESLARFWSIEEASDGVLAAMEDFDQRPKSRRAFGRDMVVPAELFAERPAHRELPESERWRFMPVKLLRTVMRGQIQVTVPHYKRPFCFVVNGLVDGVHLSHGHTVLIAFHPGQPEQGCWVFNGDVSKRNREGLGFGEYLVRAEYFSGAPQFDLRPDREGNLIQKAAASMRSEARVPRAAGQAKKSPSASVGRDGIGAALSLRRGDRAPADHSDASEEGKEEMIEVEEPKREQLPVTRLGKRSLEDLEKAANEEFELG